MNFSHLTILLLLCSLTILQPLAGKSQTSGSQESISQLSFKQLDLEKQRILVQKWMNQSQQVEIPNEFKLSALEFFKQQSNGEAIYQKYLGVFRPLFNPDLLLLDRINFCSFLLNTFGEDEIPMNLIRKQKEHLINLFTK